MISVREAHSIIDEHIPEPVVESVSLNCSGERVLAEEMRAPFPQPRFTNSAMDGFAVRSEDTRGATKENPVSLKLIGILSAGDSPTINLEMGECTQIMTGAPLPSGSDAVVMVENTSGFESHGSVEIYKEARKGQHIRYRGEEIKEGDFLISPGVKISSSEIGVLATFGYGEVDVYRRPSIALFVTGDELREPGETLEEGQIYNSNLYLIADLAKKVGAKIVLQKVLKDNPDSLKHCLLDALDSGDIIVSSGGVSAGRYDFVRKVLLEFGIKEHFWKVAQKPGKPLFFGSTENNLVFGIPGNPVSAFICFIEYIWPTCERWMGLKPKTKINAQLEKPFPRDPNKHRFLFGEVWADEGKLVCAPTKKLGSHMLTSTLKANCIIEAGRGSGYLVKGNMVQVNLLPWKFI
jgi:molybdopterin molybdotransferase